MDFMIKLDANCLKHINLFQRVTKARVKDCIINGDRVLFVVSEGQAGIAIGKNGVNIKKMQRLINKRVEVVEYSDDLLSFLNNLFRPIKIKDFTRSKRGGKEVVKLSVDTSGGNKRVNYKTFLRSKARKAKNLLKKYYGIDTINFS